MLFRSVLAARSIEAGKDLDARLTFAFRRVLGRKPTEKDSEILRRAFEKQKKFYDADAKGAAAAVSVGESPRAEQKAVAEHAALTAVCLAILNLDEALTRE